jgi:penicillin amidase
VRPCTSQAAAFEQAQGPLAHRFLDLLDVRTFDGDPLNGPVVDGRPLYAASYNYADGLRIGRIVDRLEELVDGGQPLTAQQMADIQGDANSNLGQRLRGHVSAAVARLEEERQTPGTHADIETYAAGLTAAQVTRMADAAGRLDAWTLDTPAAVLGTPSAGEIANSVATSIFNHWIVTFLDLAFADELTLLGRGVNNRTARTAYFVLAEPETLVTGLAPETGEPVLCDDLNTTPVESCTLMVLMALDSALERMITDAFGTDDADQWRWGLLHRVVIGSLLPADELNIPPDDDNEALRDGYPRHGDGGAVDASHPGWSNFDFTFGSGPAMRHIVRFDESGAHTMLAIPGGASSDRATGHFRDLMDEYWFLNEYFDLPGNVSEILDNAESRTRFRP